MSKPAPVSARVERRIAASPEALYDLVTDVTRMGEWSPETIEAKWIGGATSAVPGARFKGTNKLGSSTWSTKPTVVDADRGRRFSFQVPGKAGARWTYEFSADGDDTIVVESVEQQKGSPRFIGWLQRRAGVTDRSAHLAEGMATTLDRLAAVVSAPQPAI